MGLAEVSNILWQERHLLDLLQFKLDEQQLLLAAGRSRWLPMASAEVERVLDELRHVELLRAIEVDALANEVGLGPNASLAELALVAPSPWDAIFDQHRAALLGAADEVRTLSEANRDLLQQGADAIRQLIDVVDDTNGSAGPLTYGAGAKASTGRRTSVLLDEVV